MGSISHIGTFIDHFLLVVNVNLINVVYNKGLFHIIGLYICLMNQKQYEPSLVLTVRLRGEQVRLKVSRCFLLYFALMVKFACFFVVS